LVHVIVSGDQEATQVVSVVAEAVDFFLIISICVLELEQLLAQGCNKVAVGRIAADFESVAVAVAVGHVVLLVFLFSRGVVSVSLLLVCFFVCVCLTNAVKIQCFCCHQDVVVWTQSSLQS